MLSERKRLTDKVSTLADVYAPVSLRPVQVDGEEVANKRAVVIENDKTQKPETVSVQSANYKLWSNAVVKDAMDDIMTRSEWGWRHLRQHWDGKRYIDMFITDEPVTSIEDGTTHPIHVGLAGNNSYDGSLMIGAEIYGCNTQCLNQYIARNLFGYFALRHSEGGENGAFDIADALEELTRGAQRVMAVAPRIRQLQQTPLTADLIVKVRQAEVVPARNWGDVLTRLGSEEPNGFGLFQALTAVTSHDITGRSSLTWGEKVGAHFLQGVTNVAPAA